MPPVARPLPPPGTRPPTLRTIATLAGPAIAGQLLQTGVIYADRVMLGHAGAGSLAAMQIAGPLEWTLASVSAAFAVGTLSLVGRAVGAGDFEAARRHTTLAMGVALVVGAMVAVLARLTIVPSLPLLFPHASRAADGALALSTKYLEIALFAAPFYCVGVAGMSAMSAAGDTVTPLAIGSLVNVVHIAINWLLIGGHFGAPALGVRGAAWSTTASYALEAVLTLAVLTRVGRAASLRPFRAANAFDAAGKRALRALARLSAPAYLERFVYHAGYMAFVWMIARLGDDTMAANQALIAIEALSFMTVEGFATAAGALVAQELGARRPREALRVGWSATGLAVATLSTYAVLFLSLRRVLPALVTPRADLQAIAASALIVVAIAQPFMAAGVVLGQAGRGAGSTRAVMLVSVACGFGVRLATTWLATVVLHLGVVGIWIGSTSDWVARTIALAALWQSGRLVRASEPTPARS
jgi:putative MATE family efflux protein